MKDYKILLADGDQRTLQEMSIFLGDKGYSVTKVSNNEDAIEMLKKNDFDLLITDNLSILKKGKEIKTKMMVMILSNDYDVNFAIDALRLGADDYLFKPFAKAELLKGVTRCFEKLEHRRKNSQPESHSHTLNDQTLNMLKVMSHDIRGPLISISATLKLLNRGYYGKIDEDVADRLKELLSKTISLIEITEEYLGRTSGLRISEEVSNFGFQVSS